MNPSITTLLIAVAVFLASHICLSTAKVRRPMVAYFGRPAFLVFYSAVSLMAFIWLVIAYGQADYVELWPQSPWSRRVPLILMPLAFVFLTTGLATANATLTAEGKNPDEHAPSGILKVTRHPILWAFLIWALAHIPANGDASALILFGMFVALAISGMGRLDKRHKRVYGEDWKEFARQAPIIPFAALIKGRVKVSLKEIGMGKIAAALALYGLALYAHPWITGLSAL